MIVAAVGLGFLQMILTGVASGASVLSLGWLVGRRWFDVAVLGALRREAPAFKEFVNIVFQKDIAARDEAIAAVVLLRSDLKAQTVASERQQQTFSEYRVEMAGHMEILVTLPGAIERLTASLNRFDFMVEGLVGKVQSHEVQIATLLERTPQQHRKF